MTKIYSMKNKHPERQPQKAISSGCSFQRYFSSSLLLVIHKRLVLTPASWYKMKVGNDLFPALIMLYAACSTMILSMGTPQSLLKAYRLSTLGRLRPCCQW